MKNINELVEGVREGVLFFGAEMSIVKNNIINIIINYNLYLTDRNYRNIILHIKYEKYELIKEINKI